MKRLFLSLSVFAVVVACSEKEPRPEGNETAPLTYYEDALPIFEQHCLGCHREGGIGPFRLDDYGEAERHAGAIRDETRNRTMPPFLVTTDGSCGDFAHDPTLSEAEILTLGRWVEDGALEGTARDVEVPEVPSLTGAVDYSTPVFSPRIEGGTLAEFDEYRCFLLDSAVAEQSFITGFEVVPGNASIVHHVLTMLVDPDAPAESELGGETNRDRIATLDGESPDREGWPCFGLAGEGVEVETVPVVWAPGQTVVEYPNQSGIPITSRHFVVIQVHYNLASDPPAGVTDQTTVRLRMAPEVPNLGIFLLVDPLLDSLYSGTPDTLAPGLSSVKYTWQATLAEFGLSELPNLKLYGAMPHMHERGRRYELTVGTSAENATCAAEIKRWDFHWQHLYFYSEPFDLTADSRVQVTCDYDTSNDTEPVLPGWGTRNEMCLATLYLTVPFADVGGT